MTIHVFDVLSFLPHIPTPMILFLVHFDACFAYLSEKKIEIEIPEIK